MVIWVVLKADFLDVLSVHSVPVPRLLHGPLLRTDLPDRV